MKYSTIFKKVPFGNEISLSRFPDIHCFDDNEMYIAFSKDKVSLRKELEKEYKNSNFIGGSFRFLLEYMINSLISNRPCSHMQRHLDDDFSKPVIDIPWFKENEERIIAKMQARSKELFAKYPNIIEELTNHFWKKDIAFKAIGLDAYFIKMNINNIYYLKNSLYSLTLTFKLNDETRKIFVEKVVDDWGNNISYFQDPTITSNGKMLLSSCTHEDWYNFK